MSNTMVRNIALGIVLKRRVNNMGARKPRRCQQLNLFASQFRHKQKYGRGYELTKSDKLWRIKVYEEIKSNGGSNRDVAIKWGISPNNSKVGLMVRWHKGELGIK